MIALPRRPAADLAATRPDTPTTTIPLPLSAALAGVDTLVFVSSDGVAESMVSHHEQVVATSIDAGVRRVVYTSIIGDQPDTRFSYAPVHHATGAQLEASGLQHLVARTSIFADCFVDTWLAPALQQGELALPDGGGAMSLLTCEDAAAALAAAALGDREGLIRLTGPDALTAGQIAEIASGAAGRSPTIRSTMRAIAGGSPQSAHRAG